MSLENSLIYFYNMTEAFYIESLYRKFHSIDLQTVNFAAGKMNIKHSLDTKEKEGLPSFPLHSAEHSNPTSISKF